MTADRDLVTAVSARIARTEMARRIPGWDGAVLAVPSGLPPLTMLADRTYPRAMLDRRLRFLRVMGWYPEQPPTVVFGVEPSLPEVATIEDHVAAVYGAAAVSTADPAVAGLRWAVRRDSPAPGDIAALMAFFDRQADAADPRWRDRWPHDPAAGTTWARIEAATLHGDRLFGRRRAGGSWTAVSALVWRVAESKRRRFG